MKNFTYGLTLSERENPVVYIQYVSHRGNNRKIYGLKAVIYVNDMVKKGHISESDANNVRELKKTCDIAFLEKK